MAMGRFAASHRQLLALTRQHRGQPYALAHKAELLEDFRRCAFHLANPSPTAEQALDGRVRRWRPSSAELAIEYGPRQRGDFDEPVALEPESERRLCWHGAVFRGPHTLELRGKEYRQCVVPLGGLRELRSGLLLHVCGGGQQHFEIDFGNRRGAHGENPARLFRWQDGKREVLQEVASPARLGAPFCAEVRVDSRWVTVRFDGKQLMRVAHGARGCGRFAVEGDNYDLLTVRGGIDPGFVRGRIDHAVQRLVDDFDRTYDANEVPEWLLRGALPSRRSFNPDQAWPPDAEPQHLPLLGDLTWFFGERQFENGLRYLNSLERDALPHLTRRYLEARFHFELDQLDRAVQPCDELCRDAPGFLPGRKLRAELHVRLGRDVDAAIRDYRAMLAAHPSARELYVELGVLLVRVGRAREAQELLARAVLRTGNAAELMQLQRMLDCAVRGPSWAKTHQVESAHYLVKSNIDAATCRQAADVLERAHQLYQSFLGAPRRAAKERYRVFLFQGQRGYDRFCGDILGERDTHTAGLYSAGLRQLLIWNLPDRAAMLRTVRHEGLHQYLDSVLPDSPAWLDEGLAEYFERVADSKVDPTGARHDRADYRRTLVTAGLLPLDRFLAMPRKVFYRRGARAYAQAWAVVHFLRHGPEQYRRVIPSLLRALSEGKSPAAATEEALCGVDLGAMAKALRIHLGS